MGDTLYGKIPPKPFSFYKLHLTRFSSSEPDYDGLTSSWKYIVDALKYYKVIEDDRLSNSGPWNVMWQKCPQKHGKIHVVVENFTVQLKDEVSGTTGIPKELLNKW